MNELSPCANLRIAPVGSADTSILIDLFRLIQAGPKTEHFHPHPFTAEEAARRTAYVGLDLYVLMAFGVEPVGYGMLRGWDEGFTIPSLGIFVAAARRDCGAGRALMEYLHLAARLRGATTIRLKVYRENVRAVHLYEALGYRFEGNLDRGQLVGRLAL